MDYKLSEKQIVLAIENGARALFEYCKMCDIHYVVTGSSGGLDSAVTLGLAQRACQMASAKEYRLISVGLIMPCNSKPDAERLGREVIQTFGAEEIRFNFQLIFQLATTFEPYLPYVDGKIEEILHKTGGMRELEEWDWSKRVAQGNIKARLRMMLGTYHVARMMKGMVLSTDNLSEYLMGFWTICGDVGDFGIIQQMFKGLELYDIARYLRVPKEIIDAIPDADLGVATGGDEAQLGAAYPLLDRVMITLMQKGFDPNGSMSQLGSLPQIDGVNPDIVRNLAVRALSTAYKRKGTIVLSRKELGLPEIKDIPL